MKIKNITPKMLKEAAEEFESYYQIRIPLRHIAKFSETVSYNDMKYFDTESRERMASFLGKMVVGRDWPIGPDGEKAGEKFFKAFEKNCRRFGIKALWNE